MWKEIKSGIDQLSKKIQYLLAPALGGKSINSQHSFPGWMERREARQYDAEEDSYSYIGREG
jgi:hypothetical protein